MHLKKFYLIPILFLKLYLWLNLVGTQKKDFFNKIDSAWKGRGEKKNEGNAFGAAVSDAKEKGEDEFEVGGEKFKVEESVNESSSKEKEIYAKIEKLRVLSNAGKITGDQFLDKFMPLWKQLKGMKESVVNEDKYTVYWDRDGVLVDFEKRFKKYSDNIEPSNSS